MKGPISASFGRFLNGFGIRDAAGFSAFEDFIRPNIDVMPWAQYTNRQYIYNDQTLTVNAIGTTTGGTSLTVPTNEFWLVESFVIGCVTTAAQQIRFAGVTSTSVAQGAYIIRTDTVDTDPYAGAAGVARAYAQSTRPFLLGPGEAFGIVTSRLIGAGIVPFIYVTYWNMAQN